MLLLCRKFTSLRQIYDDNREELVYSEPSQMISSHLDISIDGDTACAFTENVEQRFLSYGWQVLHVDDGDRSVGSFSAFITVYSLIWFH